MARSGYEKIVGINLKKLKGVTSLYEPLKIPYVSTGNYLPDYVIFKGKLSKTKKDLTLEDLKGKIIIESKGYFKLTDLKKMLSVKETHPDLDIRMLFQKNSYVYPNRKKERRTKDSTDMKYGDWCDKHGFPWAVGEEIPNDWLL